ncbi:MAG: hypothetical protein JOZ61_03625 [Verrucomicrobia bacterium]|nr:hypothetical protein [Verrucomicrobiota bacterium]
MVVKGDAKLLSSLATRQRPEEGLALPPGYVAAWQCERLELENRREARRQQWRFRHNPDLYLKTMEKLLLKLSLPS